MKTSMTWAWAAFAISASACPASNPQETSLEPSSPMGASVRPTLGPDEKRYAGTYTYAGTPAERAAVEAAVDRATEGMIGRGIARSELMKRSEIRPSYSIGFDGKGNVSVETPGFPTESSPLDGTEVKMKDKYGDVSDSSQRFVGGALLQLGRTGDGSGSTQFVLQPDASTLLVTRVMKSSKLPGPVEFTLTYVRQPRAP